MISSLSLVSWLRSLTISQDQSNYYLREESKKECREETAQNKADKLLTSLQRDNQSRRQEKIKLSLNLTSTKLFCNRDSTRFPSKYEFKHAKDIKIYHI